MASLRESRARWNVVPFEWAIRRALQEAEPCKAACFDADGQVFLRAIDYPDVELAFYHLSGSDHAVQKARGLASSIQRTVEPFAGPLFKWAPFRTRPDEYYWFVCCLQETTDGVSIAPVGRRVAATYSLNCFRRTANPTFLSCRQSSKARWLVQAVPTSKSNSHTLTEPPDEKRVSGRG